MINNSRSNLWPESREEYLVPQGEVPISLQYFDNMNAVVGVNSDGFAMTVLPEISAGAIFQVKKGTVVDSMVRYIQQHQ